MVRQAGSASGASCAASAASAARVKHPASGRAGEVGGGQGCLQPVQRLGKRFHGRGVADADAGGGAECIARDQRHVGLLNQVPGAQGVVARECKSRRATMVSSASRHMHLFTRSTAGPHDLHCALAATPPQHCLVNTVAMWHSAAATRAAPLQPCAAHLHRVSTSGTGPKPLASMPGPANADTCPVRGRGSQGIIVPLSWAGKWQQGACWHANTAAAR